MPFSAGLYSVGEPKITGVTGRPGAGVSELCFSITWTIFSSPKSGSARIHSTQSIVHLGVQGLGAIGVLGHGWPETVWFTSTLTESRQVPVQYRLYLTPGQILEIERIRAGRGLNFMLEMRGVVEHEAEWFLGFAQCNYSLTPLDWAIILRSWSARDIVLVGVDLPINGVGDDAAVAVRRAHEHLVSGAYDAAISESRKAIESLLKRYSLEMDASKARNQLSQSADREKHTLAQRRLAVAAAVQHLTHLGVHTGNRGELHVFSREDAAMVVVATAALVSAISADYSASAHGGLT